MPRPTSVLSTWGHVLRLERQVREAEEKLKRLKARLEMVIPGYPGGNMEVASSVRSAIQQEMSLWQGQHGAGGALFVG